ncbi:MULTISPECIES: cupin domain-containing protein [unclassified Paraburkholderia]|uniref:cupin domain-containing protein n=1 Tax=unclassified Paraburkholderia TaxID=2615204 RepID=UPI0020B8770E|nr:MULTISPECIES: cupin domain-containing protein [unclassified Paraburkholderia]MCP3714874.1 cupin domain-containing protein [Paraburkholderia sp. CNPSo 3281]MCX5538564.1 cupin domain-containing protein [Paraburkholderia sp. CNPSo 3076]
MNESNTAAFGNLFAGIHHDANDERTDTLVSRGEVLIERIVSTGQASPPGFWYDDAREEWVALLAGAATLEFEDPAAPPRRLLPGDYVHIPAHCRHRVSWTDPTVPSVWLAVYVGAAPGEGDGEA